MMLVLAVSLIGICLVVYFNIKDIELLSELLLKQNEIIVFLANEEIKRKKNKEE